VRLNIIIPKAIGINPISNELGLKIIVQEGGVPKGPAGLENHGRDKVRCGVNKEINVRR
jgi:hypothetical protein